MKRGRFSLKNSLLKRTVCEPLRQLFLLLSNNNAGFQAIKKDCSSKFDEQSSVVHLAGVEPATSGFEAHYSIQLSYKCMFEIQNEPKYNSI
jgi:hypothetical protein